MGAKPVEGRHAQLRLALQGGRLHLQIGEALKIWAVGFAPPGPQKGYAMVRTFDPEFPHRVQNFSQLAANSKQTWRGVLGLLVLKHAQASTRSGFPNQGAHDIPKNRRKKKR